MNMNMKRVVSLLKKILNPLFLGCRFIKYRKKLPRTPKQWLSLARSYNHWRIFKILIQELYLRWIISKSLGKIQESVFFKKSLDSSNCIAKFENYCPKEKHIWSTVTGEGVRFEGKQWSIHRIMIGKWKKKERTSRSWYSMCRGMRIQKCVSMWKTFGNRENSWLAST